VLQLGLVGKQLLMVLLAAGSLVRSFGLRLGRLGRLVCSFGSFGISDMDIPGQAWRTGPGPQPRKGYPMDFGGV
jgi:hypothetical protein